MADEQPVEGGLLEEVGINLVVEEAGGFKKDLDSSRAALDEFAKSVGGFNTAAVDFNAAMLKVSTTLYTVNQRSGNIGKLTAALTAFTKIPETAAKITGFASGAARELDTVAVAMARIAAETQKTVSAIKAADLSGAMASEMRKAVREAADQASNDEKAYFAAAIGAMVSRGMEGVKYEGDGGKFKAMLQKTLVAEIEKFATGGAMSRSLRNLAESVQDAAQYVGPGIASGIARGRGDAVKSTVALAKAIEDALRDTLEIHSPSEAAARIGEQIPLGLDKGMLRGMGGLLATAKGMGLSVMKALNEGVNAATAGGMELRLDPAEADAISSVLALAVKDGVVLGAREGFVSLSRSGMADTLQKMSAAITDEFIDAAAASNPGARLNLGAARQLASRGVGYLSGTQPLSTGRPTTVKPEEFRGVLAGILNAEKMIAQAMKTGDRDAVTRASDDRKMGVEAARSFLRFLLTPEMKKKYIFLDTETVGPIGNEPGAPFAPSVVDASVRRLGGEEIAGSRITPWDKTATVRQWKGESDEDFRSRSAVFENILKEATESGSSLVKFLQDMAAEVAKTTDEVYLAGQNVKFDVDAINFSLSKMKSSAGVAGGKATPGPAFEAYKLIDPVARGVGLRKKPDIASLEKHFDEVYKIWEENIRKYFVKTGKWAAALSIEAAKSGRVDDDVRIKAEAQAELARSIGIEIDLANPEISAEAHTVQWPMRALRAPDLGGASATLEGIFEKAGVKLLGIIDEEDILSAARGRQYRARRSEGALGGTLSETAFYVEGKFPEETHTASADTGTSERIFVPLIEDAIRRFDFTETARSLGNTIRRNLGEFDNQILEDPFGQKAIAAAPAAQAATAAVGKANAQLAATAATAADANRDAAGATGQVAGDSKALSKETVALLDAYRTTRKSMRTPKNRAYNTEFMQKNAFDTIRAAAGARGFVPGTGKNKFSLGHGAGYVDFSSPEYQARMRAFEERGGKISDLFGDTLGSRSPMQDRARLEAEAERRRKQALATYSPISTTMPWQDKVEPKGLIRDEDIDRLNLFVDTALAAFFEGKLDLANATAEDFREQLDDKKVALEFSRSVEGTVFGRGRSTDIVRYAKARTGARAKRDAQINKGTYAWVETEMSDEYKRLKEIIGNSDTIDILIRNLTEYDRELTAEYKRKAAEISQIISDGQAAAKAAGETYKRDPELENQLAMYRELGARRDPVSAKKIDELQKKRKEIIDKVTQDAPEIVKLAQPQAAENAKNIQLALARYEAASGPDKLGIENEIRDLMAAQATFVDSVAAEATTGLFEATGVGKKLSAAQARLDKLAPRWETWTAKERVEAESLIDELARYEDLKKRFVLSKQEEIRAFLTGGAEATPKVSAITRQIAEVERRSIADPSLRATVSSIEHLNTDYINKQMALNAAAHKELLALVNGNSGDLAGLIRTYEETLPSASETKQQPNDILRADLLEVAKRGSEGEAKIAEVLRKDMVEFGALMGQLELYRTGASGAGTWGAAQIKRTLWEVVSDRSSPLTKMALEYADVVDEFSAGIAAQKDIVDNIVTKTSRRGRVTREKGSYTDEARAVAGQTQDSMQAALNSIPIVIDAISTMVPKELAELRGKVEGAGSDILTGKARQMLLDIIDDAINGGGIAAGLTNLRTMAANQVGVSISALRSGSNVVISPEERARMDAQIPIPGKAGSMLKGKRTPGVTVVRPGGDFKLGITPAADITYADIAAKDEDFELKRLEEVASSAEMLKGYYLNLQQQQEGIARGIRKQIDTLRAMSSLSGVDDEITRLALELAETNNKIDKYKDHIKRVNAGVAAANERLGDQTPLMGVASLPYGDTVAPADRTKYDNEELERKAVAVHRDALFKARAVIEAPIQNIEVYAGTFALAMDEAVRTYFDVVEWNIGRSMAGQAKDLDLPKFAEALRSGDKNERKEARDLFRQAVGEADWSKLRETIGATVPSFISNMEAIVGDVIDQLDATGTGDDASNAKIEQFIADRIQPILLQIGQFSSEFTEAFKGVEINKQSPESLDKLFGVLGKMKEFGFGISRAVGELSSEIATMAPAAQAATQNAQKASAAVGSMDDALKQVALDLGGAAAPAAQQATSAAKATAAATDGLDDVLRDITDDLLGTAGSATRAAVGVAQAAPDAAAATAVAGASGPTLIEYNLPTRDGVKCPCDAAIAKLGDRVVAAIEKLADAGLKASSGKPYEPKYKTKAEEKAAAVDLEGARRDYKGQALDILLKRAGEASAGIQRAFELDPEEMARQLSKVEGEVARITGLINERFDKVDTVSGMRQATGRTIAAINSAFKNIDYTEFARSFQNQAGKIAAEIDSLTERSAKNIISFRSGASSAVNKSGAPAAQMATANNEIEKAIVKAENDLRDLFARQGEMSITELRIRRQMIIDEMRATGVQIVDAARSLSVLPELRTDTAITKLDTRMAKALSTLKGRIDSLKLDPAEAAKITKSYDSLLADVAMRVANIETSGVGAGAGGDEGRAALDNEIAKLEAFFAEQSAVILEGGKKAQAAFVSSERAAAKAAGNANASARNALKIDRAEIGLKAGSWRIRQGVDAAAVDSTDRAKLTAGLATLDKIVSDGMARIKSSALSGIDLDRALTELRADFKKQEQVIREGMRKAAEAFRAGEAAQEKAAQEAEETVAAGLKIDRFGDGISRAVSSLSSSLQGSMASPQDKAILEKRIRSIESFILSELTGLKHNLVKGLDLSVKLSELGNAFSVAFGIVSADVRRANDEVSALLRASDEAAARVARFEKLKGRIEGKHGSALRTVDARQAASPMALNASLDARVRLDKVRSDAISELESLRNGGLIGAALDMQTDAIVAKYNEQRATILHENASLNSVFEEMNENVKRDLSRSARLSKVGFGLEKGAKSTQSRLDLSVIDPAERSRIQVEVDKLNDIVTRGVADLRASGLYGALLDEDIVKLRRRFSDQERVIREGITKASRAFSTSARSPASPATSGPSANAVLGAEARIVRTEADIDSAISSRLRKVNFSSILPADATRLRGEMTSLEGDIKARLRAIESSGKVGAALAKDIALLNKYFKEQLDVIDTGYRSSVAAFERGMERRRKAAESADGKLRTETRLTNAQIGFNAGVQTIGRRIDSKDVAGAEKAKWAGDLKVLESYIQGELARIEASGMSGPLLERELSTLKKYFKEQEAIISAGVRAAAKATNLDAHAKGRRNTVAGLADKLRADLRAVFSSGLLPPALSAPLQKEVEDFANMLATEVSAATSTALSMKSAGASSAEQEKVFADLGVKLAPAYEAVRAKLDEARASVDSVTGAVEGQSLKLEGNLVKLREMARDLSAVQGVTPGMMRGVNDKITAYFTEWAKKVADFRRSIEGATPEEVKLVTAQFAPAMAADYKRVSDSIKEVEGNLEHAATTTVRVNELIERSMANLSAKVEAGRKSARELYSMDSRVVGAEDVVGMGAAFIGYGKGTGMLPGHEYVDDYRKVMSEIESIERKLQSDLTSLRLKSIRAAGDGNLNLVKQYESQMRMMASVAEKQIEALTFKTENRVAAVDKLIAQTAKYREYAKDVDSWFADRRQKVAQLGTGVFGFGARANLRMRNFAAEMSLQFAIMGRMLRTVIAPLVVFTKAIGALGRAFRILLSPVYALVKAIGFLASRLSFGMLGGKATSATKSPSGVSLDVDDGAAERVGRKGRAAGKKAGEQMAVGLRDSKGRFVSEAEKAGETSGKAAVDGVRRGSKRAAPGGILAIIFGTGGGYKPTFRDSVYQGIGVGIGAGIVGGIVRSIQNMGHNIQFALRNILQTGFQGIIQKESDKMLMQVQASNEALSKGVQDSSASWETAGEMADEYYSKIENLAKLTSFGKQPLVELFQNMIMAGGTMEQAIGASGNVAAFLDAKSPGNKQAMKTIGEQMAQMMQLGVLQMQDIKPLMQTGLVPVYEYLAKDLKKLPEYAGMTMDELKNVIVQKLKDGEIASDAAWAAIMNGMVETSKRYAGKAALVLGGMLSTFEDIRLERTTQLLEPLTENLLKPLLEWANELLSSDSVVAKFAEIGERISEVASGITEAAAGAVGFVVGLWQSLPAPVQDTILLLGKVAQAFALLAAAIVATKVAILLIAPAVAAVSSGLAALGAIKVGLLIGIPVAIGAWIDNLYGFRDAVADAFDFVAERFSELVKFISGGSIFQPIIDTIGGLLGGAGKNIRGSSEWAKENSPTVAPGAPTSLVVREAEKTGGLIGKAAGEAATVTFDEEFEGIDPKIVENAKKAGKDMASALAQNEAISQGFEPAALGDWRKVEYEQERAAEESKGMFVNLYEEFDAAWGRGYQAIMGWLDNIQTAVSTDFTGWAQGVYDNIRGFFAPAVNFLNQQVLPAVGQFVQGFLDWVLAIPQNLGLVIDVLIEWGKGVVQVFYNMLSAVANMISGFFGMGQDAGSAYVDGMGAADTSGLDEFGVAITREIQPHSPPRFLPELDRWGTDAATLYLDAWGAAGTGAIKELGRDIGDVLQDVALDPIQPIDIEARIENADSDLQRVEAWLNTIDPTRDSDIYHPDSGPVLGAYGSRFADETNASDYERSLEELSAILSAFDFSPEAVGEIAKHAVPITDDDPVSQVGQMITGMYDPPTGVVSWGSGDVEVGIHELAHLFYDRVLEDMTVGLEVGDDFAFGDALNAAIVSHVENSVWGKDFAGRAAMMEATGGFNKYIWDEAQLRQSNPEYGSSPTEGFARLASFAAVNPRDVPPDLAWFLKSFLEMQETANPIDQPWYDTIPARSAWPTGDRKILGSIEDPASIQGLYNRVAEDIIATVGSKGYVGNTDLADTLGKYVSAAVELASSDEGMLSKLFGLSGDLPEGTKADIRRLAGEAKGAVEGESGKQSEEDKWKNWVAHRASMGLATPSEFRTGGSAIVPNDIRDQLAPIVDQAAQYGSGTMGAYVESMIDKWNERSPELFQSIALTMEDNLEAHSPPNLLPDLDVWGTAAADSYLEGWLQADFSMLNDLADSLISALSADEGALDEDEIKRIRSAVAQMVDSAVDLGKVDIDAIMRAGGDWGGRAEQVRRLAEAYANLAVVQHKSAEATSQLEWVNTKYDAMLGPLQRRLEALRKSQEKSTLDEDIAGQQRVIDNIYATDAQREAARLKLEELNLQKQINTLEEEKASQADPLQDIIDSLALQNLEAQRALDLVKERWDIEVGGIGQAVSSAGDMGEALENVAEKAKEAGEETKRAFTIPEFDTVAPAEGLLSGFQQKVSEVAEEVKTKWGEATEVFKKTGETLKVISDNAGAAVDAFIKGKESGIFVEDSTVLGFFTNLGVAAGTAGTAIGTVASALKGVWGWLNRTWNYGPFADQATTTITGAGGEQMGISVPSDDAQQWNQSAGLVERVQFTLTAIVDAAKVGMTSLETEMKAWTTEFSAWWESDGKVKFADVQKQVSAFFSGIPAAILGALGVDPSGDALGMNQDINDVVADSASVAGKIANKFISWLSSGIAAVDWVSAGAAATASLFLITEKLLVWISGFIFATDLAPLAKESGEATGKVIAGAVMGAIFGGVSLAMTTAEGEGDSDSNLVTRTVSSLVLMVYEFIMGVVNGFARGIQDKVSEALGVSQEWKQINSGQTAASQEIGEINAQIAQLGFSLSHPEYVLPGIDTTTAEADLENLKLKLSEVYAGNPDTLSKQAQESLKSWSLGLTSNNATEEERKLGRIVWDNISAGGDAAGSVDKFMKAMTDYAGTDPAKQEQANLGVALALGIHAGMLNEEVKRKIQSGSGYPAALQKVLKEEFGIESPSSVFRDEIGKPLGEGILQGMRESLGFGAGAATEAMTGGASQGAETVGSLTAAAMNEAGLALDGSLAAMKEKWNAFKADVVAIHNALWLGVKGESDKGYADQQLSLDTFTASWLSVKLPAFKDAVIDLANQIKDGVIAKMQEMVDGVTAKLEAMIAVITSEENLARAYDAGKAIGDSIVKGIVEGMTSKDAGDALDDVADELIDLIKRLVKEAADSNSPSRLMAREVGLPLTQGVAMGMVSHAADMALLDASKMVVGTTSGYLTRSLPDLPALRNIGSSRLPGISGGENIVMHNEVRREYHLHLTVSPQQAVRAEYNFAVLEAMAS